MSESRSGFNGAYRAGARLPNISACPSRPNIGRYWEKNNGQVEGDQKHGQPQPTSSVSTLFCLLLSFVINALV